MSRKVFVTNIPVRACIDGWVEVPDDTSPEDLDGAITAALRAGRYSPEAKFVEVTEESVSVEKEALDKWEYSTPLEAT